MIFIFIIPFYSTDCIQFRRSSVFSSRLFVMSTFHVGFVVNRVTLWQVFRHVNLGFPCQCHPTNAPYSYVTHTVSMSTFHVGFVVNRVTLWQVFRHVNLGFPCQCHPTNAPYSYVIHTVSMLHFTWDLWWTEWHFDRFFVTLTWVSPASVILPMLHTLM